MFCTGANYKQHVLGPMRDETMRNPTDKAMSEEEMLAVTAKRLDERAVNGVPYGFVKLPSCTIGAEDDVILPRNVEKPDWEPELGIGVWLKPGGGMEGTITGLGTQRTPCVAEA